MRLTQAIIDLIYPPQCLCCRAHLAEYREVQVRAESDNICFDYRVLLCEACQPPRLRSHPFVDGSNNSYVGHLEQRFLCRTCGEATSSSFTANSQCVACQVWPPPIHEIRSMWRYTRQVEDLIKAFKYGKQRGLRRYLSGLLIEFIVSPDASAKFSSPDWDLIIPIPSGLKQLRNRGFAHTSLIATSIGKALTIPVKREALISCNIRNSQTQLSTAERWENMSSAFEADHTFVEDKNVLLIDDVITTGATLWHAAWALLEAGAKRVDALTLARSRQFQSLRLRQDETKERVVGNG